MRIPVRRFTPRINNVVELITARTEVCIGTKSLPGAERADRRARSRPRQSVRVHTQQNESSQRQDRVYARVGKSSIKLLEAFSAGNFDAKHKPSSGRPVIDDVDTISEKLERDRHINIAEELRAPDYGGPVHLNKPTKIMLVSIKLYGFYMPFINIKFFSVAYCDEHEKGKLPRRSNDRVIFAIDRDIRENKVETLPRAGRP
ncbi:hypothetical protein EVAR_59466_1 [Eumeta japonica]|uniref:Uncharacterized protein n=1 Tax=Eumeta variegata TaxID=151549 RepID=A0A4C1YWY9_EUMVA|nr:hypothetical protein EVAR_59466_1 [Eumeta japonica]